MPKKSEPAPKTPARAEREAAIAARYEGAPSPRALHGRGDIDKDGHEQVSRFRAEGPPIRPFGGLVAALRAERERQGLSLSDVAARSGMDRAAVHKLEIGLNKNPTAETLTRYASALGKRITWSVADEDGAPPAATDPAGKPPARRGGKRPAPAESTATRFRKPRPT